jgi:threonine dehydrogenase-like Zn-dependent dehydrogenase
VPAVNCLPLPDELPYDEGVLIGGDTLGVGFHALAKVGLRPRDRVAVVGCGPVGLGFVRLLSFYGVQTIAAEVSPYRRALALRAGAASVVDPSDGEGLAALRESSGGGVDIGIDASGTDAGVNLALDATRDEGRFIFAGAGRKATINPWSQFLEKELVAYGVWYFVDRDYYGLLDLYRQGLQVTDLITHRFPLDDAAQAYDLFDRGEAGKVIFEPNGLAGQGQVGAR